MLCPNRVFRQHTGNLPDGPDAAAIQQKLDSVGEKLCATIGRLEELRDKLALLLAAYGNFDMFRTPIILHVSAPCPHTHTHTHTPPEDGLTLVSVFIGRGLVLGCARVASSGLGRSPS